MVGHLDLPWSTFEDSIAGSPMTVDKLFQFAQTVQRTSMDPLEIKAAPPLTEPAFKGAGTSGHEDGDFGIHYVSGTGYDIGESAKVLNPRVIGFVFRGFDTLSGGTLASQFIIDCYKNIEWRPQTASGLTVPEPRRVAAVNTAHQVVSMLDSVMPDWKTRAMNMARGGAQQLAYKALAYSGQLLRKNAPRAVGLLMG
jgi:hypothetical protein